MDKSIMDVQHAPARNSAEWVASLVVPGFAWNMLRNAEELLKTLAYWLATSLTPYIRYDFGERQFSFQRALMGLVVLKFAFDFASLRSMLSVLPGIQPLPYQLTINRWFLLSYIALALWHLLAIHLRNRRGIPHYSYSFGTSWLEFLIPLSGYRISDWVLYRFIEPGLCLLVAWMLPDSFMRQYLLAASFALLYYNNAVYNTMRQKYLDLVDGEIASHFYNRAREDNNALQRTPKAQMAGFTVMPVPHLNSSFFEGGAAPVQAEDRAEPEPAS